MNVEEIEALAGKAKESFRVFASLFIDDGFWEESLHSPLCDFMQYSGNRMMVVLPRGFLKTTFQKLYLLWRGINDTQIKCLIVSNNATNSGKMLHGIRSIVESNTLFQVLFPEVIPNFGKVRWSDSCACLQRENDLDEGTFETAGVGSAVVSRHYNLIVEDDTVAPSVDKDTGEEVMPSRGEIESAIGWHKLAYPLMVNQVKDTRLVTSTVWTYYDLIKYVRDNEKEYKIFDVPAVQEDGTITSPNRFSQGVLDGLRTTMGAYLFSALFMNKAVPKEMQVFKPEWIDYFDGNVPDGDKLITVDPAISKKQRAHNACVLAACRGRSEIWVDRYEKGKWSPKELIDKIIDMYMVTGIRKVRVEANGYQAAVVYGLQDRMKLEGIHLIIEEVKAKAPKEERILALQPIAENMKLHIRRNMQWLENEMTDFPHGKTDDVIDTLAWQVPGIKVSEEVVRKKSVEKSRMWTLEEMMESLYKRRGGLPFEGQLSPENSYRYN